jgi:hypothetical protein
MMEKPGWTVRIEDRGWRSPWPCSCRPFSSSSLRLFQHAPGAGAGERACRSSFQPPPPRFQALLEQPPRPDAGAQGLLMASEDA